MALPLMNAAKREALENAKGGKKGKPVAKKKTVVKKGGGDMGALSAFIGKKY